MNSFFALEPQTIQPILKANHGFVMRPRGSVREYHSWNHRCVRVHHCRLYLARWADNGAVPAT